MNDIVFEKALMLGGAVDNVWYPSLPLVPAPEPDKRNNTTIYIDNVTKAATELADLAHRLSSDEARPPEMKVMIKNKNAKGVPSGKVVADTLSDLQQVKQVLLQQHQLIQQLRTAATPLDAEAIEAKDTVSISVQFS